ncbi:type II toxin-antitoxin system VapC family toxin [Marivirga sp.]|uniref:type II toxin-antitoxin system VapC family toxin n=1 Tax=Marivirga sp. TaxID=2018662 RepID=UPI003DA715AC
MEQGCLIDTNVIIDYLANKLPEAGNLLIYENVPKISVVTRLELLSWPNASEIQMQILDDFIDSSIIYNLDEDVILKTIEIRKNHKIKLPDSIIAANALVNDLTLLSRNVNDFKKIENLEIINPYNL